MPRRTESHGRVPVDNAESVQYDGEDRHEDLDTLLSEMPVYNLIKEAEARRDGE